jgi:hypothetical protein
LSIVAVNGFVPQQLDVKAAFLYGELKETIYMPSLRVIGMRNKVAHLKRCIYGLNSHPESGTLVVLHTYEDTGLTHPTLTLVCFGIRAISFT